MDIMSNNLANADTTGFKKEGSTSQAYSEVMAVKIKDVTENPNTPKRLGKMSLGVKIGETYTDFSQGSLRDTGNTYDIAIGGDGFFNIEFTSKSGETSTKYTRAGSFTLTKDGYLVTKDGDYVLGKNGRIQLSTTAGSTVFNESGDIFQDGDLVASLKITEFEDTNYLTHYGETMWPTTSCPSPSTNACSQPLPRPSSAPHRKAEWPAATSPTSKPTARSSRASCVPTTP